MKMKKLMSIVTAITLVSSMTVTNVFAAKVFTDITDEKYDWARDNIERMADMGLISGYDDGTFKPDQDITKLECIALFARAMGSVDEANQEVLARAHEAYDDLLSGYGLTWGQDELVYMLYKGALTKSDLDTYILDVMNHPMKRYEAAVIITKAMGGEDAAKAQTGITLDYADAKEIPTNTIQYVNYVTEQGIMTGMDDNNFEPLQPVLRSQMATMLARVVDKTAYEYIDCKLTEIDETSKTITVVTDSGEVVDYAYGDETSFKIQGVTTTLKNMLVGVDASITLSNGVAVMVDAMSSIPDEVITGKYQGYQIISNKSHVSILPDGEKTNKLYECSDDLTVTYGNSPGTLKSFTIGDIITITLENGKVKSVEGQSKDQKILNAKVVSVNIDDYLMLEISHADTMYDGKSYAVADNVYVLKNSVQSNMSEIYPGDTVDLTLEYGEITRVVATSATKTYTGTIQSVNISTSSSIVLRIDGNDREFVVPAGVSIKRNGEEATLYDFRVGDTVTVTTESDAILKIVAQSSSTDEGKILGTVTNVNTSYGFIKILRDGSDVAETVYCKESTTTVVTSAGAKSSVSAIKEGDVVEARCTISNGAYTAQLIIIEK